MKLIVFTFYMQSIKAEAWSQKISYFHFTKYKVCHPCLTLHQFASINRIISNLARNSRLNFKCAFLLSKCKLWIMIRIAFFIDFFVWTPNLCNFGTQCCCEYTNSLRAELRFCSRSALECKFNASEIVIMITAKSMALIKFCVSVFGSVYAL